MAPSVAGYGNQSIRRGLFPSEDAAEKRIYLEIRGHGRLSRSVRVWLAGGDRFATTFEDPLPPMDG
jgi:hypothetical protein